MIKTTATIEGMHCGMCETHVNDAIRKAFPVKKVKSSAKKSTTEIVSEEDFNCLFCYCPLYALGPDCGGNFTYTDSGRKNCKGCALPHVGENGVHMVMAYYEQLAALAGRDNG